MANKISFRPRVRQQLSSASLFTDHALRKNRFAVFAAAAQKESSAAGAELSQSICTVIDKYT